MIGIKKSLLLCFILLTVISISYFVWNKKESSPYIKQKKLSQKDSLKDKEEKHKKSHAKKHLSSHHTHFHPDHDVKDSKIKSSLKAIDSSYKNSTFSIVDVQKEEITEWLKKEEAPEGFTLSTLVLKVNPESLSKNEIIKLPVSKKAFIELERKELDFKNQESFVWHGASLQIPNSHVLLSWHKGFLEGYVNLSKDAVYKVDSLKEDHVVVRKVDPSALPKTCAEAVDPSDPHNTSKKHDHEHSRLHDERWDSKSVIFEKSQNSNFSKGVMDAKAEENKKIRVLFLYNTSQYSLNSITAHSNGYISSLNSIFRAQEVSQADVFEIAGIESTELLPSDNMRSSLSVMRSNASIQQLRHRHRADLVALLQKNSDGNFCGRAGIMGVYSVSTTTCNVRYVVEHEIGHNLGAAHEKEQKARGRYSYSHGYYTNTQRTIMSYYCWRNGRPFGCQQVRSFSTAKSGGIGNAANDNIRTFRNTVGQVKNLYEDWIQHIKPKITRNPFNLSPKILKGSTLYLIVGAKGRSPLRYQWYKEGQSLRDQTSANLILRNVQVSHAGRYYVKVTNDFGSAQSRTATVKVGPPPRILTDLTSSLRLSQGAALHLSVRAEGTPPLRYQWYKDGQSLRGQTSAAFTLQNVQASHSGGYHVKVANDFGSVKSRTSTVKVGSPPRILTDLTSYRLLQGATLHLSVRAEGTSPLRYQWYKEGQSLRGQTSASFTLRNVQSSDAGRYHVTVTNSFGNVDSSHANIQVTSYDSNAVSVLLLPDNLITRTGESVVLEAVSNGVSITNYLWYKNGVYLTTTSGPFYKIETSLEEELRTYLVEAVDGTQSYFSNPAVIHFFINRSPTSTPPSSEGLDSTGGF